jgi:hypothetical protein
MQLAAEAGRGGFVSANSCDGASWNIGNIAIRPTRWVRFVKFDDWNMSEHDGISCGTAVGGFVSLDLVRWSTAEDIGTLWNIESGEVVSVDCLSRSLAPPSPSWVRFFRFRSHIGRLLGDFFMRPSRRPADASLPSRRARRTVVRPGTFLANSNKLFLDCDFYCVTSGAAGVAAWSILNTVISGRHQSSTRWP